MIHDVAAAGRQVQTDKNQTAARKVTSEPAAQRLASMLPVVNHTVQAGDTLSGIAVKYQAYKPADMDLSVWIQTIQVANGLGENGLIKPGQVLKIPQLAIGGETLDTQVRPDGPYDPSAGLTFPTDPAKAARASAKAPPRITGTPGTPSGPLDLAWQEHVVAAARDSLGVRYVWGGTNLDKGVDCSGLTQQVYDQMGVDLPRTSGEQFKAGGRPVSREELQPGDLVFFRNGKGRVCHVGVYSGKDEQGRQLYISATTHQGVAEVAIDDWTRWNRSQKYAGARRFDAPTQAPPLPPVQSVAPKASPSALSLPPTLKLPPPPAVQTSSPATGGNAGHSPAPSTPATGKGTQAP